MVKHIVGDIFKQKSDVIVHQANCQHTMGSGIARFIRETFPEAYEADLDTPHGDPNKMGTFSFSRVKNPAYPHLGSIVNLYSQFDFSATKRHTRYDAMLDGLILLRDKMRLKANGNLRVIAIPHRMGCNRGGGDWNVVQAIIHSVFAEEDDFRVFVCEPENPEALVNAQSR